MSKFAFAKKLAKVAAKWPTCCAFAAVANVAAQRPDGVGVAWIRQFQAEVRRALEPALDAGAAPVATAEGEDEMPAADEGASEDEGCEAVAWGYTFAPAPLPPEAAARLQDASLATAANAAQRATSTVACLEELDRQSAGSVPHSSSFVDGSSGDDADAVCGHNVGGCCTVARPGAMLCESHAEEVFADMDDDWRAAARRYGVTVIGTALAGGRGPSFISGDLSSDAPATSAVSASSAVASSAAAAGTLPARSLECVHCGHLCTSESELCDECGGRVRRLGGGSRRSKAKASVLAACVDSSDEDDDYLPPSFALSRRSPAPAQAPTSRADSSRTPMRGTPNRRLRTLVERAVDAGAHLGRNFVTGMTYDMSGAEVPYVKTSLKGLVQELHNHARMHAGAAVDLRPLFRTVCETVAKTLSAENGRRAMALDDKLMQEGWACLDPDYAADLQMMAMTGFGELTGPRFSDIFIAIRSHFGFVADVLFWYRFAGKNNKHVKRRKRGIACCAGCLRATPEGRARFRAADTFVQRDEFGIRPETRCGVCTLQYLWEAHDGSSGTEGAASAQCFRALAPGYRKFSWQNGAKKMPRRADGSLDAASCFLPHAPSLSVALASFQRWGARINERRHAADPSAPKLHLDLFRLHSLRHGAVKNLKHLGVTADEGAPFLCMSRHFWDTVYGMEEAEEVGEHLTPFVAGCSRRVRQRVGGNV